jgi:hypothetical protein
VGPERGAHGGGVRRAAHDADLPDTGVGVGDDVLITLDVEAEAVAEATG